jgi:hypothetical protein
VQSGDEHQDGALPVVAVQAERRKRKQQGKHGKPRMRTVPLERLAAEFGIADGQPLAPDQWDGEG